MERAIAAVGAENIATNQIELSPYLQNRKVVEWAAEHGIHITSYMTLAYGKALKDEVIAGIAAKHNATPAQVILAWAIGEGYAVIPSSTKRENLASNLKAQDLQLDEEDRKRSPRWIATIVWLARKAWRLSGIDRLNQHSGWPTTRKERSGTRVLQLLRELFYMLAKKVDKCPDARADGSVTVVNRAERHFNRQALLGQQFNKLPRAISWLTI
jgi:hypothetical protein